MVEVQIDRPATTAVSRHSTLQCVYQPYFTGSKNREIDTENYRDGNYI